MTPIRLLNFAALILAVSACAQGEDQFRDRVAPLFADRCLSCHNSVDRKGDFSLQTRAELLDSGFVEANDPGGSHLLTVLTGESGEPATMPKNADPLSDDDIAVIRQWIQQGAPWPDGFELSEPVVDDFEWWSLQPIATPAVPEFESPADRNWVSTPVDAFVLSKLRERGLEPSREADRRTPIRRVTYDLIGLPPTPEQVREFVTDDKPRAWERLVERLLNSPQYGERWARHWLDVARYADTCGYDKDKLRPNAWPYRDYVVRSLNDDKPFGRFIREQIAGDVLFPGTSDGVLGLGFLAAGPWDFIGHVEVPESKIDGMEARNLDRDEMVSGTLNAFCSITIQCARCHNHKFDPFTQEHYYSLQSVFAAVDRADRSYDADPQTERRRTELKEAIARLKKEQTQVDKELQEAGGMKLRELDQRIERLGQLVKLKPKRPEFGYHSAIAKDPGTAKWVQVDVGEQAAVRRIVLRPCHDDYAGIGAGFGFPLRFQVLGGESAEQLEKAPLVLADSTATDFENPGLIPVEINVPDRPLRFFRVTAVRLAERKDDYIFALAELQVLDAAGTNLARAAAVTAADSIEAPPRWRRDNLVDGVWPEWSNTDSAAQLAKARADRTELLQAVARANPSGPNRLRRLREIRGELSQAENELRSLPDGQMVYAAATHFSPQGSFRPTEGKPRRVRLLHRGNITQPRGDVQPGTVPLRSGDGWQFRLEDSEDEGARRAALANWIASPDNPLTWRSIVNRVWLYHFGRGIVETPNDFGRMGQQPTHPELLDWLAAEFRDHGQSLRELHRLIVLSSTYRQASDFNPKMAQIDSDNRYLWRMNRRRLQAEELRDSVLAVSGKLDPKMGGPGYYLFELQKTEHSPHYEYHLFDPEDPATHRRSLYRFIVRSQPDPFMTTLDCADSSQSTPKRNETLTSLQALSLLNNRFMLSMAKHFAARLDAFPTVEQQVEHGMLLVTGRLPNAAERNALTAYCAAHGTKNLCRVLLNLSEFVYVD